MWSALSPLEEVHVHGSWEPDVPTHLWRKWPKRRTTDLKQRVSILFNQFLSLAIDGYYFRHFWRLVSNQIWGAVWGGPIDRGGETDYTHRPSEVFKTVLKTEVENIAHWVMILKKISCNFPGLLDKDFLAFPRLWSANMVPLFIIKHKTNNFYSVVSMTQTNEMR